MKPQVTAKKKANVPICNSRITFSSFAKYLQMLCRRSYAEEKKRSERDGVGSQKRVQVS